MTRTRLRRASAGSTRGSRSSTSRATSRRASEDALGGGVRGGRRSGGTRAVILNFTGLEYMNSGGIGLLVTLLVRANRAKQKLLAFGLDRALPADLRADASRRGDRHLRHRGRGRRGRGLKGRQETMSDERAREGTGRRGLGEARRRR